MRKSTVLTVLKLIALALLLPIVTGFGKGADSNGTSAETGAAPTGKLYQTVSSPGAGRYDWRSNVAEADRPQVAEGGAAGAGAATDDGAGSHVIHSWETGAGKSYLYSAIEVPSFLLLLNLYDRVAYSDERDEGKKAYSSNLSTTWDHLRKQNWRFDKDPFNVNQFAHPYEGATMFGLARSCGLSFWESWAYSNAGSFLWEMAGETTRPSINDMITTGNSGSLLGEALFRMSALVLGESGHPDTWHELGAAVISPPTAFNRWLFGDRFKPVFPSHSPATFWRFRFGVSLSSDKDATADFAMSYGLPGQPGYSYKRPLDYFDFQVSGLASKKNPVGNVLLRGLLLGTTYEAGENYRGIWGIYGSYDYIAPTTFRVSTTALSLGTTGQYWIAPGLALQGTVLGGAGFGGAGVRPLPFSERDYHYGFTPQGILSLRLILGSRAAFENVLRGYLVTGTGSDNSQGSEAILRFNTNLIIRLFHRHGLGLQFVQAVRHAQYRNLPNRHQSDGTFGIFYTFLGDSHFGAVQWHEPGGE